jgi:hypothetical protein
LAPVYEKLGKHFSDNPNIVIAKMDATANDIPSSEYQVSGFPTLFFKPAGGSVIPFEGGRELDNFIQFINENKKSVSKDEL